MGRLHSALEHLAHKKISARELTEQALSQAEKSNPQLNAYLEIFRDSALEEAKQVDAGKRKGKLAGIPLGIKDMISIKGRALNASSKMLQGYVAPRSATVVERLENEGAVFLGRLNCDEFAMGSSNENTPFGAVKNPYDLTRTAGGSSGGSAASVAGQTCLASLGTDTGGSIRLPAAFCGIVGLKPTYGRVSRSGVIAFASSLDQVGPLADDVLDTAHVFDVIAGADPRDANCLDFPFSSCVAAAQAPQLKGLKVGVPQEFFQSEGMDAEVAQSTQNSLDVLKREGAELIPVQLPHTSYGIAVYYVVATAEAASNLSRYDGVRYGYRAKDVKNVKDLIVRSRSEGFGPEVKRRILLGTFALSSGYYDAYYAKAQFVRSLIQKEYLEALQKVDVMVAPVSPSPAFKIGERMTDPLQMYLSDIFTVSMNLAGVPALSVPAGLTKSGLPLGIQFVGSPYQEHKLFSVGAAFERAAGFKKKEFSWQ
jgi:aspartyl-tRNA(Asn)/glutamyl-tRNA(Gln) amidotransferase subunit A